jgi:hypothetical protein
MLDLGRQRERHRALTPLEQVGVAAVGDDHVGERVSGERDVGQRLVVGRLREPQLKHADRFTTVGHRSENRNARRAVDDLDVLAGEHTAVGAVGQPHALGGLEAVGPRDGAVAVMAETDERLPAVVRDEKRDRGRAEQVRKALPDHVNGRDRRRVLHRAQQLRNCQAGPLVASHAESLRARRAGQPGSRTRHTSGRRLGCPGGKAGRRQASRGPCARLLDREQQVAAADVPLHPKLGDDTRAGSPTAHEKPQTAALRDGPSTP